MSSHEVGTIKFIHREKGFGFILADNRRAVFFRQEVVVGDVDEVTVGRRVLFVPVEPSETAGNEKGGVSERAIRVVLLREECHSVLDVCPTCGLALETL